LISQVKTALHPRYEPVNPALKKLLIVGTLSLGTVDPTAYGQRPSEVVKWTANIVKATPISATVALSATIADGWHVYALSQKAGGPTPLKITISSGAPFALQSPIQETKVIRHDDPSFKMETVYYLNTVNLTVAVKKEGASAVEAVPVDVRFQACNDKLCLPPYTLHLTADLKRK
jgi:hypothetical protein